MFFNTWIDEFLSAFLGAVLPLNFGAALIGGLRLPGIKAQIRQGLSPSEIRKGI